MKELARYSGHRFRRHVRKLWTSRGGGFYGFVATLMFLYLETLDLAGDVASLPAQASLDLGFMISWLVENFVELILNGVRAAIWPVEWITRFGVDLGSGALLVVAYGAYRLVRPTVLRLLEEPEEEGEGEAEGAGGSGGSPVSVR